MGGRNRARRSVLTLLAGCAAVGVGLAGCTPSGQIEPSRSTPATSEAPSGEPTSTPTPEAPAEPTFHPDGSALRNLDYFDLVNERLIAEQETPDGRAFVDNLVEAGFDKEAMEVTPDRTAVDLPADNIQFSVRIRDKCLLGQFGNTGYVSDIADVLSTGKCLVGRTRPIDW